MYILCNHDDNVRTYFYCNTTSHSFRSLYNYTALKYTSPPQAISPDSLDTPEWKKLIDKINKDLDQGCFAKTDRSSLQFAMLCGRSAPSNSSRTGRAGGMHCTKSHPKKSSEFIQPEVDRSIYVGSIHCSLKGVDHEPIKYTYVRNL